ncbi:MAG TPA: M10 family metallopeptidase C-terminal domain-containing protein [Rhizomicrobium sp.]|nr:M10 family metallopeptidase C-terminal domain-containing protein [Rhizomicrobium sp.]
MRVLPLASAMLLVSTAAFAHHVHSLTFTQKLGPKCIQNIYGTPGNDTLGSATNACHEYVLGNDGDDVLIGGTVSDTLNGGNGFDKMTGNGGHDTFAYTHASDSDLNTSDEITDFNLAKDKVDLSAACANAGVTCTFIGDNFFTGTPGEVSFSVREDYRCDPTCHDVFTTVVWVDMDGDGNADMAIDLDGQLNGFSASNLVL